MAQKSVTVDLDLRAKEFGDMTIAVLSKFAAFYGYELHIEFTRPAPMPGPKKGAIR